MKSICLLLCAGLLFFCTNGWSHAEEREVITTGKYVMGDLDSKKDARKLALLEAKQAALEQAGTYLKTFTKVKDYQLTEDEISSLASGLLSVTILEEKWTMEGENPAVRVKIKAVVRTDELDRQVNLMRESEGAVQDFKAMQSELAALKKELEGLKRRAAEVGREAGKPEVRRELKRKKETALSKIDVVELVEEANRDFHWGRFQSAEARLARAIELDPENVKVRLEHARALMKLERFPEARNEAQRALAQAPDDWHAHAVYGWIHLKARKPETAIRSFSRAISLNGACGRCYLGRGIAHQKLKQMRKAYRDFKKACELDTRKGCERARGLEKMGRELLKRRPPLRRPPPHRRPFR